MIPYCQHQIRDEDREAVSRVLDSPRLTQGPAVAGFEAALRSRTASRHAVACSSGTSALQIALQALGVGPGDEVIVPSLSFLATANAVLLCGARPVFADVEPDGLSIDPADVARRVTTHTRGVIPMHYAGHPASVAACRDAVGPDRFVLEDACHALGAEVDGQPVGSLGDAACFSFHPAKHVTTGEGGAVVTNREDLATTCLRLREHGMVREPSAFRGLGLPADRVAEERGGWIYEMHALSGNHRLPDLGAALGESQLARLDDILATRRALAARYDRLLAGEKRVRPLPERPGTRSAWHLYPVRLEIEAIRGGRAAVHARLHEAGIGVQVHYVPIHLQPFHRERLGTRFGDLPRSEDAYLRLLSLPLFPGLSDDDQERVVEVLCQAIRECGG
ncbi:MAG TPA: aminotransferase class I/II-fold pyridoxal phosphate-dependent enzyme [Myxococcota bacterium]|nr:aminotransferase class I/II-fold pyridoxal phosphate-dependent enzyme [Myxococcales bacterium]HPG26554.1 aminotransferase class I/II-fold pyridoxal phosphate-dependent enzyme [Myxococcota bacterium]